MKTTITDYLLDHQSPTGYAQAIEERVTSGTGTVAAPPVASPPPAAALPTVSYVFGHEIITQARAGASDTSQPRTAVYRHDAHSGVRQLAGGDSTYPTTTVVYDNYTYEVYGTLLPPRSTGNQGTPNTHLYRGETWDAGLGMTYLRARYVDHKTGRFVGMDPWEGSLTSPLTFQDFVYAHNDPLGMVDPSGENAIFGTLLRVYTLSAVNAAQSLVTVNASVASFAKASFLIGGAAISAYALYDLLGQQYVFSTGNGELDKLAEEVAENGLEALEGAGVAGGVAGNNEAVREIAGTTVEESRRFFEELVAGTGAVITLDEASKKIAKTAQDEYITWREAGTKADPNGIKPPTIDVNLQSTLNSPTRVA